ncbi:MAG: isocitrate lyase/PEP mutase family protein [Sandaracinaceae bacterium]|nr:isocitrate lyase/PEP mutase family protein [Sandaracinaceae bacterium]
MNRIQSILNDDGHVVLPGVYDALSAKLAERAGFRALFVSGYAVSATYLGEPDVGLLTQTEMLARLRTICRSVSVPVIADADTGYGNALNVIRTVNELIDAGAAGCFLEDQVWPKRCGHMQGKKVVPRAEFIEKLRAAVDARGTRDFAVCARTDAIAAVGLDEALARMHAARDVGVDLLFVEAPRDEADMQRVVAELPGPLVANMVEGGKTPLRSVDQLRAQGFQVLLYPVSGLYAAAHALSQVYGALRRDGITTAEAERMVSFDEFGELIGLEAKYALASKYEAP